MHVHVIHVLVFVIIILVLVTLFFSPGMLGADTSLIGSLGDVPLTSRLALIGGTSSCHMMVSATPTIHAVHVIALFGYKYYC